MAPKAINDCTYNADNYHCLFFSSDLKIQCLAKSLSSFAVKSPLGFSFRSAHHCSLPTSAEHPDIISRQATKVHAAMYPVTPASILDTLIFYSPFIIDIRLIVVNYPLPNRSADRRPVQCHVVQAVNELCSICSPESNTKCSTGRSASIPKHPASLFPVSRSARNTPGVIIMITMGDAGSMRLSIAYSSLYTPGSPGQFDDR